MPSSNRSGTASVDGSSLSGCSVSSSAGAAASTPRCGPKNLYGEQAKKSAPSAGDVDRRVRGRGARRRRTPARRPRGRRRRSPATSGRVPSRLEAAVTATSRVAVGQHGLDVVELGGLRVEVEPAHGGAGALGGQHPGPDVRVVVEPGDHDLVAGPPVLRDSVRATSKVSWVIERPNTTPPGSAPSRSATAARAPSDDVLGASLGLGDRAAVGTARRSASPATASATSRGTWEPPGPSKWATPRPRAGNWARTASTSYPVPGQSSRGRIRRTRSRR